MKLSDLIPSLLIGPKIETQRLVSGSNRNIIYTSKKYIYIIKILLLEKTPPAYENTDKSQV